VPWQAIPYPSISDAPSSSKIVLCQIGRCCQIGHVAVLRTTQGTCHSPWSGGGKGMEGDDREDDRWNQHVVHVWLEECAGDAGGSEE
jgi:hypothetical protein